MLATIVVRLWYCGVLGVFVFPGWLMRPLVSRVDRRLAVPIQFWGLGFVCVDEEDLAYVTS